jgi:hypothetical protein
VVATNRCLRCNSVGAGARNCGAQQQCLDPAAFPSGVHWNLDRTLPRSTVDANILGKMADPAMPTNAPSEGELQSLDEYQRWILHGAAPNYVALSPQERDGMFSPDKYRTGKATHQLFALCFYRKSKGSTPELDRLMQELEERIAWEAVIDFRVTDLYLQRLAFLPAAGRPDLIRPRWVERASLHSRSMGLAGKLARLVSNALPLLFWR